MTEPEFNLQPQKKKRRISTVILIFLLVCMAIALGLVIRANRALSAQHTAGETMLASAEEVYTAPEVTEAGQEDTTATSQAEQPKAVYRSPEGISFVSYSAEWHETKLSALYQELLQNRHGAELSILSKVIVYAECDEHAAATHQSVARRDYLYLKHPAFPRRFCIAFSEDVDVISLYDGDNRNTPELMAWSLSHEYGHLFTFYYMFHGTESRDALLNTEYARLRGLETEKLLFDMSDTEAYYENHLWYLIEIAADDYATLMGSPHSRSWVVSYDIADRLYRGLKNENDTYFTSGQENLSIPSAWQVAGLASYFFGLIDETPPAETVQTSFSLQIEPQSRTYTLEGGKRTFLSYRISWEKVFGEDAVYTLLAYDSEDASSPRYHVRTVSAGTDAEAYIGEVATENNRWVSYVSDTVAEGKKTFIIKVLLPDGRVVYSEPLEKTF